MDSPRTLICGSLAYDTIMVFPDRFARHILPEQVHLLSVSFQIGEMRREWGGCAGNIAYNLQGLGGAPVVMATLGDDGVPYRDRMTKLHIAQDGVRTVAGTFTAQAFIITDLDDNQITAFHPGAMNSSHENRVGDVERIALGIVAPDGRDGMRAHVEQFANAKIPFIFDPGQGLPLFSGPELLEMIDAATFLAVNDYEGRLLAERTGVPLDVLAGASMPSSRRWAARARASAPAVASWRFRRSRPTALVDPTGCGDAYRAGVLYGIAHGFDGRRPGGSRRYWARRKSRAAAGRTTRSIATRSARSIIKLRRIPLVNGAASSARPTSMPVRVARVRAPEPACCRGRCHDAGRVPWIELPRRRELIRRWSVRMLRMLRVEARFHGVPPGGLPGNLLIVANHISWLDIFVLNTLQPARFVAKAELAPLAGRRLAVHECRHACSSSGRGGGTRAPSTATPRPRCGAVTSSRSFPKARRPTA